MILFMCNIEKRVGILRYYKLHKTNFDEYTYSHKNTIENVLKRYLILKEIEREWNRIWETL